MAKQYFAYLQSNRPDIKIISANVGREHRIGSRRVDALVTDLQDIPLKIIEVHGVRLPQYVQYIAIYFSVSFTRTTERSVRCSLTSPRRLTIRYSSIDRGNFFQKFNILFRPLRWIDVNARSRIRQMELEREQALIVEVVWECEIKKLLQNSLSMEMFFKQYDQTHHDRKPIEPRDSLFG